MAFRNFLVKNFFSVGPPAVGNSDLLGVWPVLGCGHSEKFRAQAENRKTQFPNARDFETGEKSYTPPKMVVRKFLTV